MQEMFVKKSDSILRYSLALTLLMAAIVLFLVFRQSTDEGQLLAENWTAEFGGQFQSSESGVSGISLSSDRFGDRQCARIVAMSDVESVDLAGTGITDESLTFLAKLPSLRKLRLDRCEITGQGLAVLASAKSLTDLSLAGCRLGQIGDDNLGKLKSLTVLNLMNCEMEGDVVTAVQGLTTLRKLYLGNTDIDSSSLAQLRELSGLELLNLTGIQAAGSEDFAALGELPSLKLLYLDRAAINDEAFGYFVESCVTNDSTIEALFLEGCPITDASRQHLERFVRLESLASLRLTGTSVTREAFDQVAALAPEVSFAHSMGESGFAED